MVETNASTRLATPPRRGWTPTVECALLFVLIVIFFAKGFAPAWRTLNTDFSNYFVASELHRHHIPLERAYEWTWFQRQKDRFLPEQPLAAFSPFPPISAAPLLPLTTLRVLVAKRIWIVLNLIFLVASAWMLARSTDLPLRRTLLLTLLCIAPLRVNFLYGQFYVFLLVLICAAYYAHCRGCRLVSGALVSVAAALKLFPGGFLILFLWRRDWRAAFGLILGGAFLVAISVAMFGWEPHRVYLMQVLPRALGTDQNPYVMRSLTGMWAHLFMYEPALNPAPLYYSPLLSAVMKSVTAITLVVAALVAIRRDEQKKALGWAMFLLLLLLLSTMPAAYHYCLLIFSAAVGFEALQKEGKGKLTIGFLAAFVFACAPFVSAMLRVLAVLAMFIVLLVATKLEGSSRRLKLAMVSIGAVFACIMTFSGFRNLSRQAQDYDRRVAHGSGGFRVGEPRAIGEGILVTEMRLSGYKAAILSSGESKGIPASADVLAVAGSPKSSIHYLELSGKSSSIATIEPPTYASRMLFPGQQPSLSSNGKWLAFIREENGRGAAWVASTASGEPVRLIPSSDDVLELTVNDLGEVYAAVGRVSDPHIVIAQPNRDGVQIKTVITGPARFPAISPDGTRLAFSRLRKGAWQLAVFDLNNRREEQLTDLPCNATDAAWADRNTLMYASDCGNSFDMTAISKIAVP